MYLVFLVDLGYAPTLFCILGADSQALPLAARIVNAPAVLLVLWRLWLVAESQELVQSPNLTRQGSDALVHVTCLLLVGKEEGEKGEVSASDSDRGFLAKDGGARSERAVIYHGVRDPDFF